MCVRQDCEPSPQPAEVEAWRFDEPLGKEAYMKLEASAAAAWREEMTRIKGKGGKGKGGDDLEDRAERAQQRVMELLRQAVLQRGPAGLDAPLELAPAGQPEVRH